MITDISDLAGDASALSVVQLAADTSVRRLQQVCSYLARIQLEDRIEKIHCRFADTRVLPALLDVVNSTQLSPLAGRILEIGQFRRIQTAAESDGIFHLLVEQTPEVVPDDARGEFHDNLNQILSRATSFKLSGTKDRVQFVMLSLTCGDGFHQHPRLAAMWAHIAENGTTLLEHMRSWDDTLWTELSKASAR